MCVTVCVWVTPSQYLEKFSIRIHLIDRCLLYKYAFCSQMVCYVLTSESCNLTSMIKYSHILFLWYIINRFRTWILDIKTDTTHNLSPSVRTHTPTYLSQATCSPSDINTTHKQKLTELCFIALYIVFIFSLSNRGAAPCTLTFSIVHFWLKTNAKYNQTNTWDWRIFTAQHEFFQL